MFYTKNLKYLTKNTKINQNQLAQKLGITRQSINKMINAEDPKASTLIKISEIYNVSIDLLLKADLEQSNFKIDYDKLPSDNKSNV